MNQSESIANLAAALVKAQGEMKPAKKDTVNPFFHSKYAALDQVMPLALETLSKHGLSVSQMVDHIEGGQSALVTMLMHESGEYISGTQPLLLSKEDPQGQGAAITYARRYGMMAAIGMVADEDDDANSTVAKPINGRSQAADNKRAVDPELQAAKAESATRWSVPGPAKYAGDCYECGWKYQAGENVRYKKRQDGKYDRKHDVCPSPPKVASPLVQQAADEGAIPLPEEEP